MSRPERVPYRTADDRSASAGRVRAHLAGDGLVAYPTETVYGLGCALRPAPLGRLSQLKRDRPFLLLVRDRADPAAEALRWTPAAVTLADTFWPGPVTLVLDDPSGAFPVEARGPDGSVGIRVSPHPAIPPLLEACGGPITSTSANRPGEPPARSGAEALELAGEIGNLLVLDGGPLPPARPSTVVRCTDEVRILREGAVPRERIAAVTEVRG